MPRPTARVMTSPGRAVTRGRARAGGSLLATSSETNGAATAAAAAVPYTPMWSQFTLYAPRGQPGLAYQYFTPVNMASTGGGYTLSYRTE